MKILTRSFAFFLDAFGSHLLEFGETLLVVFFAVVFGSGLGFRSASIFATWFLLAAFLFHASSSHFLEFHEALLVFGITGFL